MAVNRVDIEVRADARKARDEIKKTADETVNLGKVAGVNIDNIVGKLFVLEAGFNTVSRVINLVGKTIKAVTFDLAVLGEQVKEVENGFRTLTGQAGVSADELLAGLEEANDGLFSTVDLMREASRVTVAFGKGVERLPEVLELSRKIAVAFGIDSREAFNKLIEAARSGEVGTFKQLGLLVDVDNAILKFAKDNDIALNAISETGRAQAILNSALDIGQKTFGNVSLSQKRLADESIKLSTAFNDLVETIGVAIERSKIFGDNSWTFAGAIKQITGEIKALTGQMTPAQEEILKIENRLRVISALQSGDNLGFQQSAEDMESLQREAEQLTKQLMQLRTEREKDTSAAPAVAKTQEELRAEQVKLQRQKELQQQAQAELVRRQLEAQNLQIKLATDLETFETAAQERKQLREIQHQAELDRIKSDANLRASEKEALLEETRNLQKLQLEEEERRTQEERLAALDQWVLASQNSAEGVARAFAAGSRRAANEIGQAGKIGQLVFQSFANRTQNAFEAIGSGAMTAGEALKGAIFGMLGDWASAQGRVMFLASIFPPNPAGLAAGAALQVLGGFLKSQAGAGGAALGAGGAGGGGAGAGFGPVGLGPGAEEAEPRREVVVNVQGDLFDSEQTKLAIVEAVRSAEDAQDFTVRRVNT